MSRRAFALGIGMGLALQADAQEAAPPATGALRGVVIDSTTMRPLTGAVVQLALRDEVTRGVPLTTETDSSGAFALDSVLPGDYIATFFHPRLELLGLMGPLLATRVTPGAASAPLTLAIPSSLRLRSQYCAGPVGADSAGAILGLVRSARDGQALSGATVSVRWFEMYMRARRLQVARREVVTTSGPDGRFAACHVPPGIALELQATAGKARTGRVDLAIGPGSVRALELFVDVADTIAPEGAGPRRGTAFVYGVVYSPSGSPLPRARVEVVGTGVTSITNEKGIYAIGNVPAGTQMLEARAIGFVPVMRPVNLGPVVGVSADIRFDSAAVTLASVEVTAAGRYERQRAAFERARRSGRGTFLDRKTIEARRASRTSDILATVPSVLLRPSSETGGMGVFLRVAGRTRCRPTVFLDGVRYDGALLDIDALVQPADLVGVAVYRGRMGTPPEYISISPCGSIVVWTGRAPRRDDRQRSGPDSTAASPTDTTPP